MGGYRTEQSDCRSQNRKSARAEDNKLQDDEVANTSDRNAVRIWDPPGVKVEKAPLEVEDAAIATQLKVLPLHDVYPPAALRPNVL